MLLRSEIYTVFIFKIIIIIKLYMDTKLKKRESLPRSMAPKGGHNFDNEENHYVSGKNTIEDDGEDEGIILESIKELYQSIKEGAIDLIEDAKEELEDAKEDAKEELEQRKEELEMMKEAKNELKESIREFSSEAAKTIVSSPIFWLLLAGLILLVVLIILLKWWLLIIIIVIGTAYFIFDHFDDIFG